MKTPKYIFIHHTAVSWKKNPDQAEATNNYHKSKWGAKSSLGFYGGYNYEVAANGKVTQFRKDGEITVAQYQSFQGVQNLNDGSTISICMDGEFDSELPTPYQVEAVKDLIEEKMKAYGIPKENIFCHRKVAQKTCPGKLLPDNIADYFLFVEDKEVVAIPDWAKNVADKAKAKGIIVDWSNPFIEVGSEKLEFILEKIGLLDPAKHEGKVTLVRFAAVLDKLGKL